MTPPSPLRHSTYIPSMMTPRFGMFTIQPSILHSPLKIVVAVVFLCLLHHALCDAFWRLTVFWLFAVGSHPINTFLTELLRGGCSSALRACHQRAGQHRQCQRLRCSMCQMTAVLRHRSTRVCFDQSARHSLQVSFGDHVMQVRSFANWRDRNTLFCNEMKAKKKTNCISRVFAMC
jgi:hypothetical protein